MILKILIVEKDEVVRGMVAEMLEAEGFSCKTARSGEHALCRLGDKHFDLLITGIQMPWGIGGIELATLARSQYPDLPIIFMTGQPADSKMFLAVVKTLGITVLRKPFPPSELVQVIKDKLGLETESNPA